MELFDLLDSNRRPTGETIVRGNRLPEGRYHVSVHVAIFNERGEMLIQQRQPWKESYPDMWDVSVGGSVIAGETSHEAAIREVREELGIEISPDLRPILSTPFHDGFDDMFTLTMPLELSALTLQAEEVKDARFASLDGIYALLDAGSFIPYRKEYLALLFALKDGLRGRRSINNG